MKKALSSFLILLAASLLSLPVQAFAARKMGAPLSKAQLITELKTWADENEVDKRTDALEKDLRRVFIYRLRFQIERRYDGSDASFLRILDFMKDLENNPQNRSLSQLSDFLEELIRCIQLNREPAENLFAFTKQYTRLSGVTEPLSAEDYAEDRAYLNDGETQSARELRDEDWVEIGEFYDEARQEPEAPAEPTKSETQTEAQPAPHFTNEEASYDSGTPKVPDHPAPVQNLNL